MRKWRQIVVDELDTSGSYPNLVCFTEFLNKEAQIACNPIASPFLMNFKSTDERLPKRARAFNTSIQTKNCTLEKQEMFSSKVKLPCSVCKNEAHGIAKCPTFATMTTEDKEAVIHENQLCFGCLRKGHTTKDCKKRHTCSTPATCLHVERKQNSVEAIRNGSTSTEDHASQEMHIVVSHTYINAACFCYFKYCPSPCVFGARTTQKSTYLCYIGHTE